MCVVTPVDSERMKHPQRQGAQANHNVVFHVVVVIPFASKLDVMAQENEKQAQLEILPLFSVLDPEQFKIPYADRVKVGHDDCAST